MFQENKPEKNFDDWNLLKQRLHVEHKIPTFAEREVWWCSIGLNIGHEENGKGKDWSRPVLIIKKFNNYIFLGVPLSTQVKKKSYYFPLNFKGKEQSVLISQLRLFGSARLTDKMGKISTNQFSDIRKVLKNMI